MIKNKGRIAMLLLLAFCTTNITLAADYYGYLFPEEIESINENAYQTKNTTEDYIAVPAYNGKVTTTQDGIIVIPADRITTQCKTVKKNEPAVITDNKNQNKSNTTFTDKHPVLTTLGIGALVVGMVALAVVSDNNEEDEYHHRHSHHRGDPPPPPQNRKHKK